MLLVTKKQVEQFTELNDSDYKHLMSTAHTMAQHLQKVLNCHRVVMRIEGFDVPHVHVHLIPVNHEHESYKADRDLIDPDHDALNKMAGLLLRRD